MPAPSTCRARWSREATATDREHAAGRDRAPDGGRRAGARALRAARRPRRAASTRRPCTSWGSSPSSAGCATGHGWEAALTAAIAVLIITCPCALALAVPAVQVAATSRLFGKGVLVKAPDGAGAAGRGRHRRVRQDRHADAGRAVAGDASGTSATTCWPRAARLAAGSRHPYARAVVRAAEAAGLAVAAGRRRARGRRASAWSASARRRGAAGLGRLVRGRAPTASTAAVWYRAARRHRDRASRFEDRLRPDAADVVAAPARAPACRRELLSGDRRRGGRGRGAPSRHRALAGRRRCRPRRSPASRR